jgi:prephenate dehydratase
MHPDIEVCGEAYVAVRHCLLGRAAPNPNPSSSSNPGSATATKEEGVGKDGNREVKIDPTFSPLAIPTTSLSHIRTLYSHPQAWGQCKAFIAAYLKSTSLHDVSSTSRAAELVAQDTSGTSAALSSAAAAKVFGLDVLANGINDRAGNTTRFLVLRNATSPSPSSTPISDATWKSLVTFTLEHTNPGSLAQCLGAFGSQGLNLTSINTRPSGVDNWHYVFYVELQGQKEQGDGGAVNRALGELGRVARSRRWLGSWESKL